MLVISTFSFSLTAFKHVFLRSLKGKKVTICVFRRMHQRGNRKNHKRDQGQHQNQGRNQGRGQGQNDRRNQGQKVERSHFEKSGESNKRKSDSEVQKETSPNKKFKADSKETDVQNGPKSVGMDDVNKDPLAYFYNAIGSGMYSHF